MCLTDTQSHNVDRINLNVDSVKEGGGFSERGNKHSCSVKGREILDHETDKEFFIKD
jgi:hypothetical protein